MSTSATVHVLLLVVSIGLWAAPTQVHGADRVRVALSDHADHVTVTSARGLRLSLPSGERVDSSVMVSRQGRALHVNRARVHGTRIRLQGNGEALYLIVKESSPESKRRHWVVNGGLEIAVQGDALLVVNRVPLEEYVEGVVGSEVNPDWHEEVLKTQAVAARTYVLHKKLENEERPFDVYAGVQDQVYAGQRRVNDAVRHAVWATRGQVITYKHRPIFAAYSSTAAGPTEDAVNVWAKEFPYLRGVECPFDAESPRYEWHVAVPFDVIESRLREEGYAIGWLATLTPYSMTKAGRVKEVRMLHSSGELIVTGQDFRRILGYATLFSTQFSIDRIEREVAFSGKGAGHGVGLCQWGAKEMAELGYRYQSILHYYYPGTEIVPRDQVLMTSPSF